MIVQLIFLVAILVNKTFEINQNQEYEGTEQFKNEMQAEEVSVASYDYDDGDDSTTVTIHEGSATLLSTEHGPINDYISFRKTDNVTLTKNERNASSMNHYTFLEFDDDNVDIGELKKTELSTTEIVRNNNTKGDAKWYVDSDDDDHEGTTIAVTAENINEDGAENVGEVEVKSNVDFLTEKQIIIHSYSANVSETNRINSDLFLTESKTITQGRLSKDNYYEVNTTDSLTQTLVKAKNQEQVITTTGIHEQLTETTVRVENPQVITTTGIPEQLTETIVKAENLEQVITTTGIHEQLTETTVRVENPQVITTTGIPEQLTETIVKAENLEQVLTTTGIPEQLTQTVVRVEDPKQAINTSNSAAVQKKEPTTLTVNNIETEKQYTYYDELMKEIDEMDLEFKKLNDSEKPIKRQSWISPDIYIKGTKMFSSADSVSININDENYGVQHISVAQLNDLLIVAVSTTNKQIIIRSFDKYFKSGNTRKFYGAGPCHFTDADAARRLIACFMKSKEEINLEGEVNIFTITQDPYSLTPLQTIKGVYKVSGFDSWTQEGKLHLMVTESERRDGGNISLETKSVLYQWTGSSFEAFQFFVGHSPRGAHHFQISSSHFIVLPNSASTKGGRNLKTEVFKFDQTFGKFLSVQSIPSRGLATSVTFFALGVSQPTYFLAISNFCQHVGDFCNPETNSTIYRYERGKFVHFQCILTFGALKMEAVKVEDQVLLVVLNVKKGLTFYQYNGWIFTEVYPHNMEQFLYYGFTDLATFKMADEDYLALSSSKNFQRNLVFYKLNFLRQRPLEDAKRVLSQWCQDALSKISGRTELVKRKLSSVSLRGQNWFGNTKLSQSEVTNTKEYDVIKSKINVIKSDMSLVEDQIEAIDTQLKNSINVNSTEVWPGNLSLTNVIILTAKTRHFKAEYINDYPVPTKNELIPLKAPDIQLNLRRKTFSQIRVKDVSLQNLNNFPLSSYVTLNGDHFMKEHVIFKSISVPSVEVRGLINGINATKDSLLLSKGNQNYKGLMMCDKVITKSLQTNYINDVNVNILMRDSATNVSSLVLKGNLTIEGDLIFPGNLTAASVSGKDLKKLTESVLLLKSEERQILTGQYYIADAKLNQLRVTNTLNGHKFPDSVFINRPQNFYHATKAQFGDLNAKEVSVDKEINGIKVTNGKLDIVTLTEAHNLTGRKSFYHIHLDDESHFSFVDANKDKEDWRKLSKEIMDKNNLKSHELSSLKEQLKNSLEILRAYRIIKAYMVNLASTKPLMAPSLLYINTDDEYDTYQSIDKSLLNLYIHMKTLTRFINLEDKEAIGVLVYKDFDRTDKLNMNKVSTLSSIPFNLKYKLEKFYKKLSDDIEEVEKKVQEMKNVIDLLNTKASTVEIELHEAFKKLQFNGDEAKAGSKVAGLISGYNFDELSISKYDVSDTDSSNITISAIESADRLIFIKNLVVNSLNGIDMARLFSRIVPLSSQELNLDAEFQEDAIIQRNLDVYSINGIASKYLATLSGTNVFEKTIKFKSLRIGGDVELKGRVNNFSLNALSSQIARINVPQTFKEKVYFNSLRADSLETDSLMLGDSPIEDVANRKMSNIMIISGSKHLSTITVLDPIANIVNLKTELLDGINISIPIENGRIAYGNVKIMDQRILKRLTVRGDVDVQEGIASPYYRGTIDFKRLKREAAYQNKENNFQGDLIFKGKVHVKDLHFSDMLDGITAKEFEDGFVLKDSDQEIVGKNMYKNLRIRNLLVKNNCLQGVNISKLLLETAKIDEDAHFTDKVFFGKIKSVKPIAVSGLVQGWNLTRDAVLISKPATFSAPKVFTKPVFVNGSINFKGHVNGFDLGKTCNSIIGTITVNGSVHFRKGFRTGKLYSGRFSVPEVEGKYWMTDMKATLPSDITFESLDANSVQLKSKINNEPILSILNGPISCNGYSEGKWTINNVFSDALLADQIQADTLNSESSDVLERILLNRTDQSFNFSVNATEIQIKDSLTLFGKLNGFKVTDFCLRDRICLIQSSKKFMSRVTVSEDWHISDDGFINSLNVGEIKKLDEIPTIKVVIEDSLQAPSVSVEGDVNAVKFDVNTIMSRSEAQTVKGSLLLSNRGGTALIARNAKTLNNLYNGINVTSLKDPMSSKLSIRDEGFYESEKLMRSFQDLGRDIIDIRNVLQNQVVTFDGWKLTQEFSNFSKIMSLLHSSQEVNKKGSFNTIALISHQLVQLMSYVPFSNKYRDFGVSVAVNCTTSAKGFYKDDFLHIATSSNCPNPYMNLTGILKVYPEGVDMEEKVFSFVWRVTARGPKLYAAVATTEASEVLILKINGRNCLLFVSERSVRQNILCDDDGIYILQQSVRANHALKILHIDYTSNVNSQSYSFLVIGNSGFEDDQMSSVNILKYNEFSGHFEPLQDIHLPRLIWITSGEFRGVLYLASIHEPFVDSSRGHVRIHRMVENTSKNNVPYSSLKFQVEETIVIDRPIKGVFMNTPSGDLFLLILTKGGVIKRYEKSASEKFRERGSINLPGTTDMETWNWRNEKVQNLAVSGTACSAASSRYVKVNEGPKILRPIFKGWKDEARR